MECALSHSVVFSLLCPWDSPGKNTGVGCHVLPALDLYNSDGSPALAGGFFTTSDTWENLETGTQTHTCTPRSIAAPLRKVKRWKQPKCPLVDEWLNMWSVCAMEYYIAVKRNEILIHATMWMNFKHIMLSQSSQIQKPHSMIPFL